MDLKLKGQTALVTASSGGIGLAIATQLAAEGARVIVNGRSEKSVSQAIAKIREQHAEAEVLALVADNSTTEGCEATIAQYPEVEILVNNLGIYEATDFFDSTDDQWRHIFEVNVMSGIRLSRHYLKRMLANDRGRVVFISSESGINPAPEMPHYTMTKTAQLAVSRCLAELTKGTQVTVNSVLPGPTHTEGVEEFIQSVISGDDFAAAEKQFIAENRPTSLLGRLIDPREIANLVAFIASPASSAINGAALRVDGGVVRSIV